MHWELEWVSIYHRLGALTPQFVQFKFRTRLSMFTGGMHQLIRKCVLSPHARFTSLRS